jgi:hypothetical protein
MVREEVNVSFNREKSFAAAWRERRGRAEMEMATPKTPTGNWKKRKA